MHSALIVVEIPTQHFNAANNQAWLTFIGQVDRLTSAKIDPLDKQQGVERLGENVWLVNFRQNPAALARLVGAAENMKLVCKILPFDTEPQWLPVASNPKPT